MNPIKNKIYLADMGQLCLLSINPITKTGWQVYNTLPSANGGPNRFFVSALTPSWIAQQLKDMENPNVRCVFTPIPRRVFLDKVRDMLYNVLAENVVLDR